MPFKATPGDIRNAAAACNTTADEVQGQLDELKGYVVNLEAWWQGIAQTTFLGLMDSWNTHAMHLHEALTQIGAGLYATADNYTASEQGGVNRSTTLLTDLQAARLG